MSLVFRSIPPGPAPEHDSGVFAAADELGYQVNRTMR